MIDEEAVVSAWTFILVFSVCVAYWPIFFVSSGAQNTQS